MKGNRNRTDLHRQQIFWRRDKVLELSAQCQTEREIAAALQICQGTIHKDIVILKRKAIENIQNYIEIISIFMNCGVNNLASNW